MKQVKLIVLDIDGTLTDGGIIYDSHGGELKQFHAADGLGIVMAMATGFRVAVITGRRSEIVGRRMAELGVTDIVQGAGDKGEKLRGLRTALGITLEETAFIGDDLNDLPAFAEAGVKIAVADAADLVRQRADFVTTRLGGHGAVREAIDTILHAQGIYEHAVERYLEITRTKQGHSTQ